MLSLLNKESKNEKIAIAICFSPHESSLREFVRKA